MSDKEIENLTFEEALGELEKIVASLEKGDVSLDKSVAIYERGEKLKRHCAKLLQSVEDKIEKIKVGSGGKIEGTQKQDE